MRGSDRHIFKEVPIDTFFREVPIGTLLERFRATHFSRGSDRHTFREVPIDALLEIALKSGLNLLMFYQDGRLEDPWLLSRWTT